MAARLLRPPLSDEERPPRVPSVRCDLHSLAESSGRWENAQPPCHLVQCVGILIADDRHGTPTRHLVLQNCLARHFLDGGDPLLDSTFCHGDRLLWFALSP